MLEVIEEIIPYIAPTLGILSTTLLFLIRGMKNTKLRKTLEKTEQIIEEIIPNIVMAEKYKNYNGQEKKAYVMTKLNQYAIDQNIKFDNEKISTKIEELINLTKNVNTTGNERTRIENLIEKIKKEEENGI